MRWFLSSSGISVQLSTSNPFMKVDMISLRSSQDITRIIVQQRKKGCIRILGALSRTLDAPSNRVSMVGATVQLSSPKEAEGE